MTKDSDFSQRKFAAARIVADRLAEGGEVDSIYVAGSLTAGLGNATSDVDLFVLTTHSDRAAEPVQFAQGDERIDAEFLTAEQVTSFLDRIETMELGPQNLVEMWPLFDTLDWYVRFSTASAIVDSPALAAFRERAASLRGRVDDLLVVRWALGYCSSLEDFVGSEMEKDFDTAAYSGFMMAVAAGKGYAASLGDLYVGHKWIYKQLRRTASDFDLTEFNRYARGGWVEDGSAGAHRLLAYGQTLLGAAALNRRLGRPLPFLPRVGDGSGLWRHPEYVPLPVGTGILLHHEVRKQIKLTPRVALIWLWCAGSGADEVTDGVLAAAASTGVDLTPDRVRSTVAKLVERELVVRR